MTSTISYGAETFSVAYSSDDDMGDPIEKTTHYNKDDSWKKEIDAKINSAHKVQKRWLNLTDDDWDKEITIISELTSDEFLDFIRADFSISKIIKLATHHPKLAVRQLFNIVRGG